MADDFARQLLDALYNPETQPPQQPSRPLREKLAGAAETVGTLGSGLLASVPAGLAGLTQMIPTRGHRPSVNRAAQKVEDVQSALTYLPRGEAGQEYLEKTAGALGVLGAPAEFLGEQTLKLTGSPFLATTANVGLDPVNYIGIPGTGKALVSGTKAAGRTIAAAPRVAGEMISDLVMPTPRAQAQRGAIDLGPQIPEFQPQTTLGLVSRADEALAALPRNKGTGAEFLRELEKTPGVRMAELEDRGLVEALSGMGKVTKADVIKALQDNPPVKLEEKVLGQRSFDDAIQEAQQSGDQEVLTLLQRAKFMADRSGDRGRGTGNLLNGARQPTSRDLPPGDSGSYLSFESLYRAKDLMATTQEPKFGKYTLPGGENYRELLLTLPPKRLSVDEARKVLGAKPDANLSEADIYYASRKNLDEYRSQHWNEPDVLAHARISDRTGPNGEKILHVEEVQSDWHQTGRKEGYKTGKEKEQISALSKQYDELTSRRRQLLKQAEEMPDGGPEFISLINESNAITPKLMRLQEQMDSLRSAGDRGVPDAPFKKNWHELMMRRLVDYAAKNGYDRIAITPGAEQASRYDLSKQVSEISVGLMGDQRMVKIKDSSGKTIDSLMVGPDGMVSESDIGAAGKSLDNVIGKELANKITSLNEPQVLRGVDLQVGGEGMKGFYDKILPTYLNELGKPYGVKVGQADVITKKESRGVNIMTPDEPEIYPAQTMKVHSFDITPQMREAIKSKGLPLYAKGGSVHISDNPDTMALELQVGGAVKAAKAAAKQAAKAAEKEGLSVPFDIPRAPAKSKEEIRPIAERMARQMTGEFVRLDPKESINPAGKSLKRFLQEKEFEKDYITRPTTQVTEPEFADIEKQLGMVKFGIPGDTTIANQELIQAGPYKLDIPSPQHGGPRFPLGGEGAWASNNPQAANVQKRAVEMSEYFNAPVMGQYIAMGPTGSNFAQHFADASLRAIDLSKMSKSQIEQFNELIRKGSEDSGPRPSFPGIQDKDQAYFWLSWDPELRKHFNALMVKPKYTQPFGLPDGRVILDAITEPALRNKEISTSGFSQFDLDPSIKPEDIPLSMHPTYTHLIPMKKDAPVRQTRYPIPAELEFPDVTKFIRERYRPSEFTPTFQKASPRQKIDQQAIDEIKMYEEMMKSLTGKKEGGAVEMASGGGVGEKRDLASKIAGGGIRGVITRGLLGMDPPEDMTPREREIYENMSRLSAPAQGLGVGKAIFIGANAKTWNKAAAARAVELEKAGVSPEQIWRETGTFRGADGKLRQEISDVGAVHRNPKELQELGKAKKEEARELQLRLVGTPGQKDLFPKALTEAKRPVREQVKQLKEEAFKLMLPSDTRGQSARFALEHPELYKAYPELGDIPVYQGVYGSGNQLGSLRGAAGDLEMSVTQSGLRRDPRSTMLHEMQHAVQSLEDMAPGGSSTMAFQDPKAFEILKQLRKEVRKPPSFEEFQRLNKYPESEAQNAYAQFLKEREANPILHPAIERSLQERAANEYYKRLAGEVEARATQYREGMGPTQRRQEFPYSSYDVLPDDLIVKPPRSGLPGAAESASEIPADIAARMAAQRAELVLRSRAMQELKDQFENLPQPPKGFLSPENILQRMDEIRRREATPSGEQIPLLKKGGKVKFTDNLDTMRLAVQKRK